MNQEELMLLFLLSWLMKGVRSFHPNKINAQAMRQADSLFSLLWWQEREDFGEEIKSLLQRISVNVSKVTNILNLIQTPTPGELRMQDNKGCPWYLVWLSVPNFDVTCTLVSLGRPCSSSVESALLLNPILDRKHLKGLVLLFFLWFVYWVIVKIFCFTNEKRKWALGQNDSVAHSVGNSVQSLSHVQLFATPWTAAHQASLSITNSWSLLKLMPIESVMPSNHLILCRHLPLPPSIFPSIRVFSNESGQSQGRAWAEPLVKPPHAQSGEIHRPDMLSWVQESKESKKCISPLKPREELESLEKGSEIYIPTNPLSEFSVHWSWSIFTKMSIPYSGPSVKKQKCSHV